MNRPAWALEAALSLPAAIYRAAVAARNFAFDVKLKKSNFVGTPVLSVGNVTSGGTGKTPIVSLLVELLQARGKSVGIVSRGYRGTENGPALVSNDGSKLAATRFGDEPTWLATKHPDVSVVIGVDRVAAARLLIEKQNVDVIIADDAFQHRRLFRNFDIVVFDASEPQWHYRSLPLGRMREPFSAICRAQAVFITKTNLASSEAKLWLKMKISEQQLANPVPVFEFESHLIGVGPIESQVIANAIMSQNEFKNICGAKGVFLASGIGNPTAFANLVQSDLHVRILGHAIFRDHHKYSDDDKTTISRHANETGAACILVTEKDAVKLGSNWQSALPVFVTRLETQPCGEVKELNETLGRIFL